MANLFESFDWRDILIAQAITTVIAIVKSGDGRVKYRPALMKIFRTISALVATDDEIRAIMPTGEVNK